VTGRQKRRARQRAFERMVLAWTVRRLVVSKARVLAMLAERGRFTEMTVEFPDPWLAVVRATSTVVPPVINVIFEEVEP